MSYFDISGATFDENLRKLETSDPAHADVFNALLGQWKRAIYFVWCGDVFWFLGTKG